MNNSDKSNDLSNSPAFTGDVLFHMRLNKILEMAHTNKISVNTINMYISCLDSFLSEIYYWIKKENGTDIAKGIKTDLESCKKAYGEYLIQAKKIKNPSINVYRIKDRLDDVFFKLNFQAHANKLILRKRDNADAAFNDL